MGIRRWFVWPPLVLALVLAQSYFWVPTYDEQARGNPGRLEEFIHASIGDASILNPILAADGSSSEINTLVFEGLIDRDENLRFRGRVAEILGGVGGGLFLRRRAGSSRRARPRPAPRVRPRCCARPSTRPERPAARRPRRAREHRGRRRWSLPAPSRPPGGGPAGSSPAEASVRVSAPPRVKLTLREVDQDLFTRLSEILGPDALLRRSTRAPTSRRPPRSRHPSCRRSPPSSCPRPSTTRSSSSASGPA